MLIEHVWEMQSYESIDMTGHYYLHYEQLLTDSTLPNNMKQQ
jgi:hypothetical protein